MGFLGVFREKRRNRTLQKALARTGSYLEFRYGKREAYFPHQFRSAARYSSSMWPSEWYAYATFCNSTEFAEQATLFGEEHDFDILRAEVAFACFEGKAEFTCEDVAAAIQAFNAETIQRRRQSWKRPDRDDDRVWPDSPVEGGGDVGHGHVGHHGDSGHHGWY
ncbi:MAG TPA: DUF6559 family protein [Capsulimonadaceae bacterium]